MRYSPFYNTTEIKFSHLRLQTPLWTLASVTEADLALISCEALKSPTRAVTQSGYTYTQSRPPTLTCTLALY